MTIDPTFLRMESAAVGTISLDNIRSTAKAFDRSFI